MESSHASLAEEPPGGRETVGTNTRKQPHLVITDCSQQFEPVQEQLPSRTKWRRKRPVPQENRVGRKRQRPKETQPVDPHTALLAIQRNPSLTNSVPAEDFMSVLAHLDMPKKVEELINHTIKHLCVKGKEQTNSSKAQPGEDGDVAFVQPDEDTEGTTVEPVEERDKTTTHPQECTCEMCALYRKNFVDELNRKKEILKTIVFTSIDQADLAMCLMLRSHLPGFCVHRVKVWGKDGAKMACFSCHTVNHETRTATDTCKWKAKVKEVKEGMFKVIEISDFGVHRCKCVSTHSRFTPVEIKYQTGLNTSARVCQMLSLNQPAAKPNTFHQQQSRLSSAVKSTFDMMQEKQIEGQKPDDSITNLGDFGFTSEDLPKETCWILKLLSLLKKQDGLQTFMLFKKGKTDVELVQIHFLWPKGADLLQTHGDVVYSDSLWQVSKDNDFLLTMVVIDQNNNLKLAASSLSTVESKDSWFNFYKWVHSKVPMPNPICLSTDGVLYIYKAFVEATGITPLEVHCLWHLIQNKSKQNGILRYLTQLLVHMSYSQNPQELQEIGQDFTRKYRRLSPQRQARMIQAANNQINTAFINLKVFTGKTLTNSYAESVNAQLCNIKMNQQETRVQQIQRLHEFSIQSLGRLDDPFVATPELVQLLDKTTLSVISNGVVQSFKKLIKETKHHVQSLASMNNKQLSKTQSSAQSMELT